MSLIQCISPVDGSVYVERETASPDEIQRALTAAEAAQIAWKNTALAERCAICSNAVDEFVARKSEIAEELTWQMGRPISQGPGEVAGFEERARYMIEIAEPALADVRPEAKDGFTRYIKREPLGVVM